MAFQVKYQCFFYDVQLLNWRVDILQDPWAGAITEMRASGEPLSIEYLSESDDLFESPIRGSKMELRIISNTSFQWIDLYSDNDRKFKVNIYAGGSLYWTGFIVSNNYSEPYDCPPYEITISANDGLGYLKEIRYLDSGVAYQFRDRTTQIIFDCLKDAGITSFTEFINVYEYRMNITVDDSPLEQTFLENDLFKDRTCYDVLAIILNSYKAIIRQDTSGRYVIYRPIDIKLSTLYGRTFTDATTKTSTTNAPTQYISRSITPSTRRDINGGVTMIQQPAKKIYLYQDYGNRSSWLFNWELKSDTFDSGTNTFLNWSAGGACVAKQMGYYLTTEKDGMFCDTANISPNLTKYMETTFGYYSIISTDSFSIEFEFLYYNGTAADVPGVVFNVEVVNTGGTKWLKIRDDDFCEWANSQNYITLTADAPIGSTGWISFKRQITGLVTLTQDTYIFRVFSLFSSTGCKVAIRNIKFYTTSLAIVTLPSYSKTISAWRDTRRRNPSVLVPEESETIGGGTISEIRQIVRKEIEITAGLPASGRDLMYDFALGDVADSNVSNVPEQFSGAYTFFPKQLKVAIFTLTGSSGTADITVNSITRTALFNGTLAQTAIDFRDAFDAVYAPDVIVTAVSDTIVFTSTVYGLDFGTTITPVIADLDGTILVTVSAVSTYLQHTETWNTRTPSGEADPVIEIIGGELGSQFSRSKQFLQLPIIEKPAPGSSTIPVPSIDIIGMFKDVLNSHFGLGNNLISVLNNSTYETFTTSGLEIISAINSSGTAFASSSIFQVANGEVIIIEFTCTLNSGEQPDIVLIDSGWGTEDREISVNGVNHIELTSSWAGDAQIVFYNANNSNFSTTEVHVFRVPRTFAFNQGIFDVKNRKWECDLIEII